MANEDSEFWEALNFEMHMDFLDCEEAKKGGCSFWGGSGGRGKGKDEPMWVIDKQWVIGEDGLLVLPVYKKWKYVFLLLAVVAPAVSLWLYFVYEWSSFTALLVEPLVALFALLFLTPYDDRSSKKRNDVVASYRLVRVERSDRRVKWERWGLWFRIVWSVLMAVWYLMPLVVIYFGVWNAEIVDWLQGFCDRYLTVPKWFFISDMEAWAGILICLLADPFWIMGILIDGSYLRRSYRIDKNTQKMAKSQNTDKRGTLGTGNCTRCD